MINRTLQTSRNFHRLVLKASISVVITLSACASSDAGPRGTGSGGGGASTNGSGGGAGAGTGGTASPGTGGATGISTGGNTTGTGGAAPASGGAPGSGGTPGNGGTQGTVTKVDLKGKKVLFIVDNPASLDDGDIMLREIMTVGMDMVVTMAGSATANPAATTMNLIVASSGASASEFATLYKAAEVPMLVFGNGTYQALGFIAASSGKGSASTPVMLTIVDGQTPLASALSMGLTFAAIGTTRSTSVCWGTPGGTAIKIASVVGTPTQLIAFAYEKGAPMAAGTAPARRMAFGFKTDVIGDLSIESYKLMNAAIEWTAGASP